MGWATLAMFATPALAQQAENIKPAVQGIVQTRKVLIWRGDIPPEAPAPRQTAQQNRQASLLAQEEVSGQDAQDDQPGIGHYLDESAGDCASCDCDNACQECCVPFWEHRSNFFGEFLYLRPTGIDMAHAIQATTTGIGGLGFTPGAAPAGAVGVLNPVYTPAFRVGGAVALDSCSSVGASWARFDSHTENTVVAPAAPGQLNNFNVTSLVVHPNAPNIAPNAVVAVAGNDINFQLIDVDYRRLLSGGFRHALNYTVGVRYGNLQQSFQQILGPAQPIGASQTNTNILFQGVGLRTGVDGARQIGNSRVSFYGKSFISVLFGEVNASYTQANILDQTVQATSRWADVRPVPILE
ncbi:MAG TPA: Lpg1974 family pore-forming outer membrane protein, partial [Pirellulales bacterium]|nr:Lpg1974 family pore-forming outer membrane protein [Pirellulales bacterium]